MRIKSIEIIRESFPTSFRDNIGNYYAGTPFEKISGIAFNISKDIPKANFYSVIINTDSEHSGVCVRVDEHTAKNIKDYHQMFTGLDCLCSFNNWQSLRKNFRHVNEAIRAIGTIDCALWDIKGKFFNTSVGRLLGSPESIEIDCYCSLINLDIDASSADTIAEGIKNLHFWGQKWSLPDGPNEGREGLFRNITRAKKLREAVGIRHRLMFDVKGNWNVDYFNEFVKQSRDINITWIEEPLPNDTVNGYKKINRDYSLFAAGEHCTSLEGFHFLTALKGLAAIQPDIVWCGGITPSIMIFNLAFLEHKMISPHGRALIPSLHIASAYSHKSIVLEYNLLLETERQYKNKKPLIPQNGKLVYISDNYKGLWNK
jgi:L-rhamnonate dehydratase